MEEKTLKIIDFSIVFRNIVDLGKIHNIRFTKSVKEEIYNKILKDIVSPEDDYFKTIDFVSQRVCSLVKEQAIRIPLPSIEVYETSNNVFIVDDSEIINEITKSTPIKLELIPMLHISGALLINMQGWFYNEEGISIDRAIDLTRLNLKNLIIKIPEQWTPFLEKEILKFEEKLKWIEYEGNTYLVGTLKDLATDIIRPLFRNRLRNKYNIDDIRLNSCISSTLVEIFKTDPICDSLENFVNLENFGREIRGLGTLDKSYKGRLESMVSESFNNLSVDQEIGIFTFILSDLILLNFPLFDNYIKESIKKGKFKSEKEARLYSLSHYTVLLDWVHLEKFLITIYSKLLSKAIATEDITPEKMLNIQKLSMRDLIAYTSGITPYPSREEFLEKVRSAHRIPELQENLEKKRDIAIDYVIQEYTLRTNRSIHLLNIVISATAAFGLMEVILSIIQLDTQKDKSFWGLITFLSFIGTLIILWIINKILMSLKKV